MITFSYNKKLKMFEIFSGAVLIAVEKTEIAARTMVELLEAAEECALAQVGSFNRSQIVTD